MAKTSTTIKEKKGKELLPVELVPNVLPAPLRFDPQQEVEFATKAAKALMNVMDSKSRKVMINGKQYLEFEDWQTISRFYNCTAGIDWTKPIKNSEKIIGYEAKALVYNRDGTIISSAEASCLRDERNWKDKPEFQLKSMAQTRAMAKALRNVFSWIVVLSGFQPTPAEELNNRNYNNDEPFPSKNPARKMRKTVEKKVEKYTCVDCEEKITEAEKNWSEKYYPVSPLCRDCQKNYKKKV